MSSGSPTRSKEEIALELAKLYEDHSEKRKSIEWKVGFGFWIGIGLLTYFVATTQSHGGWPWSIMWCYLMGFVVWVFGWQVPLHSALDLDKKRRRHFELMALGEAPGDYPERPEESSSPFVTLWGWLVFGSKRAFRQPRFWGQVLMTGILLVLSLVILRGAGAPMRIERGEDRISISVSGDNVEPIVTKLAGD